MPWTLYRYILKDVVKLLLLSTIVMIAVISLAASVRPLADGMLTPFQLMKFIFYIAPTMLGFILPFTVAFSVTIVFSRLTQDNELLACSASGMSYRSILAPIGMLGVVLALVMFMLANVVIPKFFREASDLIERDALTVLTAQLNRNQPFRHREWVLYADSAREIAITPEIRQRFEGVWAPRRIIELNGVAVANLTNTRKVGSDATAERATAMLFTDEETGQSWVLLQLRNAVYFDPIRGRLANRRWTPMLRLPDRFSDNPKFLSWNDLQSLSYSPYLYDRVRDAQEQLVTDIAQARLRDEVVSHLEKPIAATDKRGQVELQGPRPGETYLLRAMPPTDEGSLQILTASNQGAVEVIKREQGIPVRQFLASRAALAYQSLEGESEPVVDVELDEVIVRDEGNRAEATEHGSLSLPMLRWPGASLMNDVPRRGLGWAMEPLIEQAEQRVKQGDPDVEAGLARLLEEIEALRHEVAVLHNERIASSVAVFLLALVGVLLSMRLKHEMVLVVYMWSFALAVVNVILINTGPTFARMIEYPIVMKAGLMWSGNIVLALLCLLIYRKIAKH